MASNRSRLRASHDLTGGGTIDRFHLLVSFCLPLVSISMRCSNVKRTPLASDSSTGSMLSRGPPLLLPAVCQTSFTKRYRRPDGAVLLMNIESLVLARSFPINGNLVEQQLRSHFQGDSAAFPQSPFPAASKCVDARSPRRETSNSLSGRRGLNREKRPESHAPPFVRPDQLATSRRPVVRPPRYVTR